MSHELIYGTRNPSKIINDCLALRAAYESKLLGDQTMPEDTQPAFDSLESRLRYFTLPMSLNYQRSSYSLWDSAKASFEDTNTKVIFDLKALNAISEDELRPFLLKYKIGLQPNKHTHTWHTIATTIYQNWGNIEGLLEACDYDFLELQQVIQKEYKKSFPYLSGPKIFHYWCYILGEYCSITLKNKEYIEIAPDTHVIKCSILLGVISETEAKILSKDQISTKWRVALEDSILSPIDMHSPLWFWSKNNFMYEI